MKKAFLIVFLFSFFCKYIAAQVIIRGPYLQQPTTNSMVVRWRTDIPTATKINFGVNINSKINSASNVGITTEHILKIENLQADTKYYYEIVPNMDFAALNFNHFFITVPKKDSKRAMHFWAGGDFGDLSNFVYETNQANVLESYMAYSKGFNTDMWLWLGDNGYGANRDDHLQKAIFDFYGSKILTKIPFSATLGNHEFDEDPINQQKTRDIHLLKVTSPPANGEAGGIPSNNKAYYSFDYGNTHFINLDSYGMDDGVYRVYDKQGAQYQWLIKDLVANKSMWTIVFFHHPPYTKRAHDSDIEEELRLIRENLVPVFDKYKVDLVLNGHSHIYERSYLLKDYLGGSQFFDPGYHIINKSSGKYLKNEPPIINKTDGTMYVVSGSFGRLEPVLALRLNDPPHPAHYYSNLVTGGSLALKIENNRLDCDWLCADGQVRDRFTLFKNVNKTTKINLDYGNEIVLKASWPGNYRWSNGVINKSEIAIAPLINSSFSVKDSLGFLEDKFEVIVSAKPVIQTKLTINQPFCAGNTIGGHFDLSNTNFDKWKYKILISDGNGNFDKPVYSQELTTANFEIKIPENLPDGINYRLAVMPNSDIFEVITTDNFKIEKPASGQFLNEANLPFLGETTLKIQFTGSFPIDYKLDFQPLATTNQQLVEIKVKQLNTKTYVLESINNICGEGKITNNKINIAAPLGIEPFPKFLKMYPNPTGRLLVIEWENSKIITAKIYNSKGNLLINQTVKLGTNYLDLSKLPAETYLLNFEEIDFSTKFIKE